MNEDEEFTETINIRANELSTHLIEFVKKWIEDTDFDEEFITTVIIAASSITKTKFISMAYDNYDHTTQALKETIIIEKRILKELIDLKKTLDHE